MQDVVRRYPWLFHAATRRKWELIQQAGGIDPSLIDEDTKRMYRTFYDTGAVVFFGIPSYYERGLRMIGSTTPDREVVILRVPGEIIAASGRLELDYTADWGTAMWGDERARQAANAVHRARACQDLDLAALILEKSGKLAVFMRIPLQYIEPDIALNPVAGETANLNWGEPG
jgi:hypothetical protein